MRKNVLILVLLAFSMALYSMGCGEEDTTNPDGDIQPGDGDESSDGDEETDGDLEVVCSDEPPDPQDFDADNFPPEDFWDAECGWCELTTCDENGDGGIDLSGIWIKTVTATFTDCDPALETVDARAIVGEPFTYDPGPINVVGTCVYDEKYPADESVVMGVLYDSIEISCARNLQVMDVISLEEATITWTATQGTGKAIAYLFNLPDVVGGGSCRIELDVEIDKQ